MCHCIKKRCKIENSYHILNCKIKTFNQSVSFSNNIRFYVKASL